MKSINDYSEYLSAIKDKTSKDPSIRDEANRSLEILQKEDPSRYTLYRQLNGEIKPPMMEAPNKERKVSKEEYIKEHPEINVNELRNKARQKLIKGPYGLGLRFDLPVWLSEEDLLSSVNQLTIPDLITASGKPVTRQTILRKCIRIAVADGRIDESKMRGKVIELYRMFCNNGIIGPFYYTPEYSYESVCLMINYIATKEEVGEIIIDGAINYDKLYRLFTNRGIKELSADELQRMGYVEAANSVRRKARKKAKKEALKAKKEAKAQETLETKETNAPK